MSQPRLRVAICGAGIGGLTCALALAKYGDVQVDVYESASQLAEVGAGIGIFPRPWKVIKALGIDQELLQRTESEVKDGPVRAFRYRKSDQLKGVDFYTLVTNGTLITIHRADFQQVLISHLPQSTRMFFKKRIRSYTQDLTGPVELLFEDGSRATCDLLIGADGLKSSVRAALLNERAHWAQAEGRPSEAARALDAIHPSWTGQVAYRALIPTAKLRACNANHSVLTTPMQYLGKNGFVIAYPISQGRAINFVAFVMRHDLEGTKFNGPWMSATDVSAFASNFQTWEPEVLMLISCVDRPLQWAIHTVKPMKSFVSGRVALLGDAAHAMCPHQGSGAGQAIEDAYILATVLRHRGTHRGNIERALQVYDSVRRPLALHVQERSRLNGRYFTFADDIDWERLSESQLWEKLQQLGNRFTRNWEWAWTTSIDGSVQEALSMLESR